MSETSEPSALQRIRYVAGSLGAVATSETMPGFTAYRARIEAERSLTRTFEAVTSDALAEALGSRRLDPVGPPDPIIGTLVSFADDHALPLPRHCYPGDDAHRLIDRIRAAQPHTLTPARVLSLALESTNDGWHALMVCHLATRHLARGRDTRALRGAGMSVAERCDAGLAIAPFPPSIAEGGDPMGDAYHYFANVIAGVLSASEGASSVLRGAAVAGLFYSGPVLMRLVRERTFGRHLFYGTHERVDRLGLAHGLALARGLRVVSPPGARRRRQSVFLRWRLPCSSLISI